MKPKLETYFFKERIKTTKETNPNEKFMKYDSIILFEKRSFPRQ